MNRFPKSEILMHYASPYYDPVKAHEYYEAHKQLKGRHSTAGLNEKGREAARYVKDKLMEEKKKKTEASRTSMKSRIKNSSDQMKSKLESNRESQKQKIEAHKEQTKSQIDSIRASLKSLSAEDRKGSKGEALRNKIESLRANNSVQRKLLQTALQVANTQLRKSHKGISDDARTTHKENVKQYKEDYEQNYEKELDAIRSDSSMVSKKRR